MPIRDDRYRKSYDAHELLDGERLVDSWTTSGGMLVLTSQRLLHEPMRTPEDFLATAAKWLGFGEAGEALKAGVKLVDRRTKWAIPLGDIAAAQPGPAGPSLTITRTSGEVWAVTVSAGLYSLRGSAGDVAARDRAVAAIRAATAGSGAPAWTPPPAGGGPAPVSPADDGWPAELRPLRRQAMTTGRNVVADRNDDLCFYFSPDGLGHMSMGGYGEVAPPGGVRPGNLVGRWVVTRGMASEWPGEAAYLDLAPTGTLGGRLQLFGALPPLDLRDGAWWWVQATSTLVLEFRVPPVEDLVMEMRVPLTVTTIEPNRVAAGADGEDYELVRAP